jgi:ribosomal protein L37E
LFVALCPKCGKNSYSADDGRFLACNHCGFIFSIKYGSDRRCEERIKKKISIVLNYQGLLLKAVSTDFSEKGLGIKVFQKIPFLPGETTEIFIDDRQIKAKVIWVNKLSDETLVGLQKINGN